MCNPVLENDNLNKNPGILEEIKLNTEKHCPFNLWPQIYSKKMTVS